MMRACALNGPRMLKKESEEVRMEVERKAKESGEEKKKELAKADDVHLTEAGSPKRRRIGSSSQRNKNSTCS